MRRLLNLTLKNTVRNENIRETAGQDVLEATQEKTMYVRSCAVDGRLRKSKTVTAVDSWRKEIEVDHTFPGGI